MTMLDSGVQTRYVELRYDGERTINGTLMHYGDVATLYDHGDGKVQERFEPGVFGNVRGLDVIMDVEHKDHVQIARTGGAGLELMDTHTDLTLRAELDADDADALNTLSKVKKGILRGLSIAFREDKYRVEYNGRNRTIIHEKATLRGVGVVARPAYPESKLREQVRSLIDMDAEETRKMVEELLAKRAEEPKPVTLDTSGFTEELKRFTESVPEMVNTAVDAALQKRALADEAAAAVAEAEALTALRAKAAAADEERMGMDDKKKKRMKDKDGKDMAMDDDDEDMADARAELIMSVTSLLPKDFETRGKTNHEILVAAAGDEIERAEERSDDYLTAKLEGIMERRDAAATRTGGQVTGQRERQAGGLSAPVSVHSVVAARKTVTLERAEEK